MSKLFQYAAILHPSEKEQEDGIASKVIVDVTTILAKDQQSATLLAARAIPEEFIETLDRVELVLRPF